MAELKDMFCTCSELYKLGLETGNDRMKEYLLQYIDVVHYLDLSLREIDPAGDNLSGGQIQVLRLSKRLLQLFRLQLHR